MFRRLLSIRKLGLAAAFTVLLAACGGGDTTAAGDLADQNAPPPDHSADDISEADITAAAAITNGLPVASTVLGDPIDALRSMGDSASTLVVAYSTGSTLDTEGDDLDINAPVLRGQPSFVETVGADGVVHTTMDLGPGASVWAEGFFGPEVAQAFGELEMQFWETDEGLVVDGRSFDGISALAGVGETESRGAFEPEVWSIDGVGAKPGIIAQAISFGPFIDTNVIVTEDGTRSFIGTELPDLLAALEESEDAGLYIGTVAYGDVADALGLDLTRTLIPAVFPIQESAPSSDDQRDAMTLIAASAESVLAEVAVGSSATNPGVIEVVVNVDLSGVFEDVQADGSLDLSADEDRIEDAIFLVEHNIQAWLSQSDVPEIPANVTDRNEEFSGAQ